MTSSDPAGQKPFKRATDVTDTLELALAASGCGSIKLAHKPRLLSDNGSSYISNSCLMKRPSLTTKFPPQRDLHNAQKPGIRV
jgi:hypothetical protein